MDRLALLEVSSAFRLHAYRSAVAWCLVWCFWCRLVRFFPRCRPQLPFDRDVVRLWLDTLSENSSVDFHWQVAIFLAVELHWKWQPYQTCVRKVFGACSCAILMQWDIIHSTHANRFRFCIPISFRKVSDRCGPAGITRFIATRPGQWNRWMVVVGLVLDVCDETLQVFAFNGSDFTAWCDLPRAQPPCYDVVFLGPGVTEGRALLYNSRSSLCTGENTN